MKSHDLNTQTNSNITYAHIIYLLLALGFFNGVTALIAVIISYVKLNDIKEPWLRTHFNWQIKTFWFWLIFTIVGVLLAVIIIGYFVLIAVWIWTIYRIVKGWLRLAEHQPVTE